MAALGVSLAKISAHLEGMGIPSPRGKSVWSKETLWKILLNEKYKGCVTLQKTLDENYLEHRQIKNIGQLDMFYMDYNHAAIIDTDNWLRVYLDCYRIFMDLWRMIQMRLTKIKMSNFRCFGPDEQTILIDNLTTFIGNNSAGKTAALSALNCMFSENSSDRLL